LSFSRLLGHLLNLENIVANAKVPMRVAMR
jgi:hypothetical protein